jgi:hypothetical protein
LRCQFGAEAFSLKHIRRTDVNAKAKWWKLTIEIHFGIEFRQSTLRKLVLASDAGFCFMTSLLVRDRQSLERFDDTPRGLWTSAVYFTNVLK